MTGKELSKGNERAKPTVVTLGKKTFLANSGRWNHDAVADYIILHGQDKYLKIGEIAQFAFGGNSLGNKGKVRARLAPLFVVFLQRSLFLAIEYHGKHNAATAVKVADVTSEVDFQNVNAKLERMRKRKELSEELYQHSRALLDAQKVPK